MTKPITVAVCLLTLAGALLCPVRGQEKSVQLIAVVNVLKQQQAEISDNQSKLDAKIAEVGESIRVARIFMSRAGGKHKAPAPPK